MSRTSFNFPGRVVLIFLDHFLHSTLSACLWWETGTSERYLKVLVAESCYVQPVMFQLKGTYKRFLRDSGIGLKIKLHFYQPYNPCLIPIKPEINFIGPHPKQI